MRPFILPIVIAGASLMAGGCVSQKKYGQLKNTNTELQLKVTQLTNSNQECQNQLSSAQSRARSLEEQLASERSNLSALQTALDKCLSMSSQGNVNISKLVDEINSSNKYIQHLVNAKNKSDSLNTVLSNNLTRSLSREEMKDVDVQVLKGVVYISLSDNMLYKSGSYEISDVAGQTLAKIAKIIKDYNDYEVLIEGNTDNVPISRQNIRNNWDLSALRASSVVQALQNTYGVDPKRLTAGGRGEYNPIASNATEAGKLKNRRTQIIITPKLDQFMDLIDKAPDGSDKKN
jgi:chemotaxis protein MotB